MEPYDLRDVISRGDFPKIRISFNRENALIENSRHFYDLAVVIRNDGPRILELWKLVLEVPEVLTQPLDGNHPNAGFSEEWITRGHHSYKRLTYSSHPNNALTSRQFNAIFPEEEIRLTSARGPARVLYAINHDIFHKHLPQSIHWRFYAEGSPMQSGELLIKETYEKGETEFCYF